MLLQGFYNGLSAGSIYVMIALGLALVFSIMRILQFAHGEIYMLGAYVAYYAYAQAGLNFFAALIVSGIALAAVGVFLEKYMFRRLRANVEPALLAAIGLSLILQNAAVIAFSNYTKYIQVPAWLSGVVMLGGAGIPSLRLIIAIIGLVLVIALVLIIRLTKVGRAMVAISQDSDAAALHGINVNRISSLSMAIGCAMAAIAGGLMGALLGLSPYMGTFALTKAIAVIILGGIGSIPGAILGGFIIGLLDNLLPLYTNTTIAAIAGFSVIIIILLIRPRGLLGRE